MISRILSLALILSFSFLLSPKELWHSCDEIHYKVEQDKKQEKFSEKQNSCSICDLDLFQLSSIEFANIKFLKTFEFLKINSENFVVSSSTLTKHNRGPPQI